MTVIRVLLGRGSVYLRRNIYTEGRVDRYMNAWVCDEYSKPLICRKIAIPEIRDQNQILVKVEASSVNPIDVRMTEGYARESMTALREFENLKVNSSSQARLPLITGRDFCGEVIQIGSAVQNVKVGDSIIGVVPVEWQGSHAEFVLTRDDCVSLKPRNVESAYAVAFCYTLATVWSAMKMARVPIRNASDFRVLIHGGSGGIGATAIQLLQNWNAQKIVATCSEKNISFVQDLGAIAIDYNSSTVKEELIKQAPFDLILDCAKSPLNEWLGSLLGAWRNCVHLSLNSPLITNTDRYGLPLGLLTTGADLLCQNLKSMSNGSIFMYAFFWPDREAMDHLSTLLEEGRIKPIIERIYSFNELPDAYSQVGKLHSRGKHVIDFRQIGEK